MRRTKGLWVKAVMAAVPLFLLAGRSFGYVDLAPTLPKVIADSTTILVVEVVEFDRAAHELVLRPVRALKGEESKELIKQSVAPADGGVVPRQIVEWASPGARAVLFGSARTQLICVGEGWYQVRAVTPGVWKLGVDRPDLPLSFYGSVSRLTESVALLTSDQDAAITVVAYGAGDEGASFDLALNKQNLPGLVRVQRILTNMNMPTTVAAASANPIYFIGAGPAGEEEIPALVEHLKSPDAAVRVEAAEALRSLRKKARPAAVALTPLLKDATPAVRFASASALLVMNPKDTSPVKVLGEGLASADAAVRRDAARATGYIGAAAAPLIEKLAAMVKGADESNRIAALQAITLLGPVAGKAFDAVSPLLDEPDYAIDAADALGRMRDAARPALKRMAAMLESDQAAVRWAAVRGMSQIGGPDAHPAVDFIVDQYRQGPTEVDGYNMMIYLALLGPVAKDAVSTIQSVRIKNGSLPPATMWAIAPTQTLPWLENTSRNRARTPDGFGPGSSGFGSGNRAGWADLYTLIYECYVRELGDRLRPAAGMLARRIMDQTAGDVPAWGYEILASGPEEALAVLTPHLSDDDALARERAVVAIGYMGEAGAAARAKLQAALAKATDDREKRLLEWSIRETSND